jgi:hypothetical protein
MLPAVTSHIEAYINFILFLFFCVEIISSSSAFLSICIFLVGSSIDSMKSFSLPAFLQLYLEAIISSEHHRVEDGALCEGPKDQS